MKQLALDIGLTPAPTFENFLSGPNQDALCHLRLWATAGTRAPVPTYLWGESGCGKTHLLWAVRQALAEQGQAVGWMDKHTHHPLEFHPDWVAVLMDDVHLYTPAQQHAAFNWFVHALTPSAGTPRWVLAAGAVPPVDLPVRDDLRSRLGWGHVYALKVLGEPDQKTALQEAAHARGLVLSEEVLQYLLKRFSRDLSSLMQLLDHLDRFALQTQRALTIPLVRQMLENE